MAIPGVLERHRGPLSKTVKTLLVCYIALVLYPVRAHVANTMLDPSWAVALNYFHDKGLIYGQDLGFTYGPLAYLILPMPFGSNLGEGLLFQLGLWGVFVGLLVWLVYSRHLPLTRLAIFAGCAIPGSDLFLEFGYAGPDSFIGLLALLMLGAALGERRWYLLYSASAGLAALLLFIKISTGIGAIGALLLLPIGLFFLNKALAIRIAVTGAILAPVLFAGGYLIYQPSFAAMFRYLRSAQEISSSYSSVMSLPTGTREITIALFLLAAFVSLVATLLWTKQSSFPLAFAALAPLFLEFKHSVVRPSGHIEIVFTFLPLLLGLVLLFTDLAKRPRWPLAIAVFLLSGIWYWQESGRVSVSRLAYTRMGLRNGLEIGKLFDYSQFRATLLAASRSNLAPDRLPAELLARVAGKSLGIFPWECSYAAANAIDYRPFPVFQTYTASSPFLDNWNAEFLDNPVRSPEFLLFEFDSIDGRHPLLDVPGTTLAMFRRYQVDSAYGPRLLLRKRANPLEAHAHLLRSQSIHFGQPLAWPESSHPLFVRAFLRFNSRGRLANFFFRIPEIDIAMSSAGSRTLVARVPPEVMQDGIAANFLPSDLSGVQALFGDLRVEEPLRDLVFTGPGSNDFENPFRVELYELGGIDLAMKSAPLPDLGSLRYLGNVDTARLELLNNSSATVIPEREVMELNGKSGMLFLQGWAFDNFATLPAAAVYIDLDGKLYPALYGSERLDVVALFKSRALAKTGIQWSIPAWKLGPGPHQISLKILSADGKGYYDANKKNHFRIVE